MNKCIEYNGIIAEAFRNSAGKSNTCITQSIARWKFVNLYTGKSRNNLSFLIFKLCHFGFEFTKKKKNTGRWELLNGICLEIHVSYMYPTCICVGTIIIDLCQWATF